MEFGRKALAQSEKPGGVKPSTFDFLGFTHLCKRSRRGNFAVHVRTMRKRLGRSLKAVTAWCRGHRHDPVGQQQEALNRKLRGHCQYYGRSTNFRSIAEFHERLRRIWQKWLNRRTRGNTLNWEAYGRLLQRYPLLRPRLSRPWKAAPVSFGLRNRVHQRARSGLVQRSWLLLLWVKVPPAEIVQLPP
jgi:hypothetical protein